MKPFYEAIAWLVVHIHSGLAHIFGSHSAAAWALSIVLLTVAMRLILFPLFVKQIKNQRAMQVLQPKMKELQAKYKNDKEKLNQEMMALWREHGANPLAGCLPLILQIPVFIALFRVLNSIKPGCGANSATCIHYGANAIPFDQHYGIHANLVASAGTSKVFGVPIFAAFNSSQSALSQVGAHSATVKIVTAVMIVLMGASTFYTQRQLMARNSASGAGSQMAQQQKILLYVLPLTFAIFGYRFPLGVLLYWLTTNIWSMGQQAVVIRRMDTGTGGAATAVTPVAPSGPAPGAKPVRPAPSAPAAGAAAPRPGGANRRPGGRNRRNRRRR